jgi:hypothetical protein
MRSLRLLDRALAGSACCLTLRTPARGGVDPAIPRYETPERSRIDGPAITLKTCCPALILSEDDPDIRVDNCAAANSLAGLDKYLWRSAHASDTA